jgi:hypothetical protein
MKLRSLIPSAITLLLSVSGVGQGLSGRSQPSRDDAEFAKYPGDRPLVGQPATPQMVLPKAKQHQTVLRRAAAEGPNFNGHYRVVRWGCGTNCIEWAVIDLMNGRVWFSPKPAVSCLPTEPPGEFEGAEWIEVRSDSRLVYLHECSTGIGRAEHPFDVGRVYEWRNGAPVLLRTESLPPKRPSPSP